MFDPSVFQPILVKAGWLGLVIAIDLILGVAVALKSKTFEWQKLADILETYGVKFLVWVALEALNFLPEEYKGIANLAENLNFAVYGLVMVSAAASILGHVQSVFGTNLLQGFGLPATNKDLGKYG